MYIYTHTYMCVVYASPHCAHMHLNISISHSDKAPLRDV